MRTKKTTARRFDQIAYECMMARRLISRANDLADRLAKNGNLDDADSLSRVVRDFGIHINHIGAELTRPHRRKIGMP